MTDSSARRGKENVVAGGRRPLVSAAFVSAFADANAAFVRGCHAQSRQLRLGDETHAGAPERARTDEVVERTRPLDVRAVRRSRVVTVEVPDVIVPAPHLIAETRQSWNHERAVEHARHRGGVFERVDLSSARVEVRANGRAPRNAGHDCRGVKREIPRRAECRTVGFVRRRVPKPHLRETKPLRVSRASVERVRGVRGDGTRAGIAS